MFWIGLGAGLLLGANVGVVIMAVLSATKRK